jgi:hypothetical protein
MTSRLLAAQFVLQHREIRCAVGRGHNYLAVDDHAAGNAQVVANETGNRVPAKLNAPCFHTSR